MLVPKSDAIPGVAHLLPALALAGPAPLLAAPAAGEEGERAFCYHR